MALVMLGTVANVANARAAVSPGATLNLQDGSAERGQAVFSQYCSICHTMVGGDSVLIGPDLKDIGSRSTIAGTLPVTRENLMSWIMNPPAIKRGTAMPALGIGADQASDLAAFLLGASDASTMDDLEEAPAD